MIFGGELTVMAAQGLTPRSTISDPVILPINVIHAARSRNPNVLKFIRFHHSVTVFGRPGTFRPTPYAKHKRRVDSARNVPMSNSSPVTFARHTRPKLDVNVDGTEFGRFSAYFFK